MKITARRAVDPIIATLLLIAIAVAAGIIVYVYVNSLAGGLTSGGGQQVSEQLSMDANNYKVIATGPIITVRNTGSSTVLISSVFFDGALQASFTSQSPVNCADGTTTTANISPTASCTFTLNGAAPTGATSGTSHAIKIISSTGGTTVFTVVAGRSG